MNNTKTDNQDPALDAAFSQLAASTGSHVDTPGTQSVRATVSRRRTTRRVAGLAVVVLVAAGVSAFVLNRPSSDDTVGPDTANRGSDNRPAIERVDWENSTLDLPALKKFPVQQAAFRKGFFRGGVNHQWQIHHGDRGGKQGPVFADLDKENGPDAVLGYTCQNRDTDLRSYGLLGVRLDNDNKPHVMGLITEWKDDPELENVILEVVDGVIKTEAAYAKRLSMDVAEFSWDGSKFAKTKEDVYVADGRWWNFSLEMPEFNGYSAGLVTFRSGSSQIETSDAGMPDPYWMVGGNDKRWNKRPAIDADIDGDGVSEVLLRLDFYNPNPNDQLLALKMSEGEIQVMGFIDINYTDDLQYLNEVSVETGLINPD